MDLGPAVARRDPAPARGVVRVIEIVGPPGAGKTTLLSRLADRRPGLRVVDRWRRPGLLVDFAGAAAGVLPSGLAAWWRGRPLARRDLERLIRLRASRRVTARWRRRGEIVVLDQGPIYTLATLGMGSAGPMADDRLRSWRDRETRDWIDLIDLIVFLEAEDRILMDRIFDRDKPHRLKSIAGVDRAGWLAALRGALQTTVDRFAAAGRATVIRCDTGREEMERIAGRVGAEIDRG